MIYIELDWLKQNITDQKSLDLLKSAPLIDLKKEDFEIKGKWIEDEFAPVTGPYYICVNCWGGGHVYNRDKINHWEYCPDCGSHNGQEIYTSKLNN